MDENKVTQLENKVALLENKIAQLEQGIYNFSDRQEWLKMLVLKKILFKDNDIIVLGNDEDVAISFDGTDMVIDGAALNFKDGIKANGTAGATTSFSTAASVTVTVTNGLITSVV